MFDYVILYPRRGSRCGDFKQLGCIQTMTRTMSTARTKWNWTQTYFTYGILSRSLLLSSTRQNNFTVRMPPFVRHKAS